MTAAPPAIFDTRQLQRQQARAQPYIAKHGLLYTLAAETLIERLCEIRRTFADAVLLGDVFGVASAALSRTAAPLALRRLDEAGLAALPEPLDAVLSFMELHTTNDVPGYLRRCRAALKPDGLFWAICLGGETFFELRRALAEADSQLYSRYVPRVAPMLDVRAAGALLQHAGFALPVVDRQTLQFTYSSLLALGRELRGLGLGNCLSARAKTGMGKALPALAEALYPRDLQDRLPLTLELVTITAWAPAQTQPQPLRPGSAQARLGDFL